MFRPIQHIIDEVKDTFRAATRQMRSTHTPQKGMTWHIVQERSKFHPYRGFSNPLSSLQIVGLNDTHIEILDNTRYFTLEHDEWQGYYNQYLHRAQSAGHMRGGGSFVPYYKGIQPVEEGYVEIKRNPDPDQFIPIL